MIDKKEFYKRVGLTLKLTRTSMGLSSKAMAEKMGVGVSRYRSWESGERAMPAYEFYRFIHINDAIVEPI